MMRKGIVAILALVTGVIQFAPTVAAAQDSTVPVRAAVLQGDLPAVRKLVTSKASANTAAPTDQGITLLMMASALGHIDIMKHLLDMGANVNAAVDPSKSGVTALMCAADGGQLDAAQLLLERGANINAADRGGNTALDYATFNIVKDTAEGRKRVQALLEEKKAAKPRSANDSFSAMFQRGAPATAIRNLDKTGK